MAKAVVDGSKIASKSELHCALSSALSFPEWYGKNLDALFDSLTDISEKTEIEIINSEEMKKNLGKYFSSFVETVKDACEENENITFSIKQ